MTQDIYGICNDSRGWRAVSEDDVAKLMQQASVVTLVNDTDGFLYFAGYLADERVQGCWLKVPLTNRHNADLAQFAFLRAQAAEQLAA